MLIVLSSPHLPDECNKAPMAGDLQSKPTKKAS